ncbi:hypothetical protein I79_014151 [Cricetulus griseus]|uniref:Uncharacterized protein n=1 Tax=Cricetulus griseus TaxID=10029 RepID=G3HTC9_CRIGR|nr:hypothetical protein I79_014151 [Cricetulus griseus]
MQCSLDQPRPFLLGHLGKVFYAGVQATPECGSEEGHYLTLHPSAVGRRVHIFPG